MFVYFRSENSWNTMNWFFKNVFYRDTNRPLSFPSADPPPVPKRLKNPHTGMISISHRIIFIFENYKTDFLFYFFNNSLKRHIFSKTYDEHKKKLNEYRKNK